jgi:hypothetical protein
MARIKSSLLADFPLPTGHVIPRLGVLETTDAVIRCTDNWPLMQGHIFNGSFAVEFDPEPDAAPEPKGKKPATAST